MNKHYFLKYILWLFLLSCCLSCQLFIIRPCRSDVPQSHKFGQYPVDVRANKTTLHVGDTIFLSLKINQHFYDSLSKQTVQIKDKVSLFVKLSNVSSSINTSNVFATDTTIYRVFNQYFTTRVLKGERKEVYLFDCTLRDGFWILELQYIALKPGSYDLSASFREILTGEAALPKGVCMLGDIELLGARTKLNTVNNQLNRVYPNLAFDYDHFGFIVE